MSTEKEQYERWLDHVSAQEAEQLREQADSIEELHDAFYRELAFGTAGLRGIIGLGPNRMNVYTVGKATQGLADYLNAHYENPSVAIARDSRNMGEEFVSAAACVLAANGIVAHVYKAIQPTPVLSFTVRDLHCSAGINVTASHNPAAYNGYKVYGEDGCQIASQAAVEIQADIDGLDFFNDVKRMDFDDAVAAGLIKWVDDTVVDRFLDEVAAQSVKPKDATAIDKLKIVYTPLNGTGLECVTRILKRVGLDDVSVVDEQRDPDGDFTTCPYPNPEDRAALELGLRLCERVNPDILLATDPDADRVGIAVLHDGAYELLTGNEVGVLLIDLVEAIESLYERYGYYLNKTINMSYPGSSGAAKMEAIMDGLRTNPPQVIAGLPVMSILDYADGAPMTKINGNPDEHQILPDANVISFDLGDGVRIIIRPSGTEPKIKAYVFSKASTRDQAEQLLLELSSAAQKLLD